jgi:hypothetical protein
MRLAAEKKKDNVEKGCTTGSKSGLQLSVLIYENTTIIRIVLISMR